MLSAKVSEDIFKKQLERLAGAVANHLQQLQQGFFTVKPLPSASSLGPLFLRFVFGADNVLLSDRYRSEDQYGHGQ